MDYRRIALAAVVAWLVDSLYAVVVWMVMLGDQFAKYPALFRSEANLPLMFAGTLLGLFALAYMYAKGYEGGNGLAEGSRFGIVLAIFIVSFICVSSYAAMNIGRRITLYMSIASFVEMVVVGLVIGGVYRPLPRTQPARVASVQRL
jgi:hypothetical protein